MRYNYSYGIIYIPGQGVLTLCGHGIYRSHAREA
jgi:hypothetical protein